jgi:hypothetical protein
MKRCPTLTIKAIKAHKPCPEHFKVFRKHWPKGMPLTKKNWTELQSLKVYFSADKDDWDFLDIDWLDCILCNGRATYYREQSDASHKDYWDRIPLLHALRRHFEVKP